MASDVFKGRNNKVPGVLVDFWSKWLVTQVFWGDKILFNYTLIMYAFFSVYEK